jgi:restriction endonuclease PvuII
MKSHSDIAAMEKLFPSIRKYQELASKHGIGDIFQDNGGKLLQLILLTGLKVIPGREGNDARDEKGNEFELKSVNTLLTQSFSTHHHLNPTILAKYRKVGWYFATYEGIELREVYFMDALQLEPYFTEWENRWNGIRKKTKRAKRKKTASKKKRKSTKGKDINNPKISVKFVRDHGLRVFVAEKKPVAVKPVEPAAKPRDPELPEGEQ